MPASRPTWPWPESGGWPGRAVATGSTRLAGVIGDPVGHSLSPALHNAAFEALGLDWVYLAFPVAAGRVGGAVEAVRARGIAGLNVTMPHKAAVLPHLDRVSPTVAALGAANTLVPAGGGVVGESTDGDGFLDSLRMDLGFEPEGCRCLVVGAGGAARAVILALSRAGARQVLVANRTPARAEEAVALAAGVGRVAAVEQAGGGPGGQRHSCGHGREGRTGDPHSRDSRTGDPGPRHCDGRIPGPVAMPGPGTAGRRPRLPPGADRAPGPGGPPRRPHRQRPAHAGAAGGPVLPAVDGPGRPRRGHVGGGQGRAGGGPGDRTRPGWEPAWTARGLSSRAPPCGPGRPARSSYPAPGWPAPVALPSGEGPVPEAPGPCPAPPGPVVPPPSAMRRLASSTVMSAEGTMRSEERRSSRSSFCPVEWMSLISSAVHWANPSASLESMARTRAASSPSRAGRIETGRRYWSLPAMRTTSVPSSSTPESASSPTAWARAWRLLTLSWARSTIMDTSAISSERPEIPSMAWVLARAAVYWAFMVSLCMRNASTLAASFWPVSSSWLSWLRRFSIWGPSPSAWAETIWARSRAVRASCSWPWLSAWRAWPWSLSYWAWRVAFWASRRFWAVSTSAMERRTCCSCSTIFW